MNKLSIGIILGLLLGVLSYFTLTLFLSFEIISQDFARVTIKNESGQNAKSILLQHGGTIVANGLMDGEEIRFIFENKGENVYKVVVTLDNNVTLTSEEVYFEIGYRGTETIKKSEIVTESN